MLSQRGLSIKKGYVGTLQVTTYLPENAPWGDGHAFSAAHGQDLALEVTFLEIPGALICTLQISIAAPDVKKVYAHTTN